MTLVYLFQLRSCKVKSLLCHEAYHVEATAFEPSALVDKRLERERWFGVTRLQVGRAQISWASRKKLKRENIAVGVGERWNGDALFRHVYTERLVDTLAKRENRDGADC